MTVCGQANVIVSHMDMEKSQECKCKCECLHMKLLQKYLPVLSSPTFNKTHANGTHPGELVDSLKALVD